MFGVWTLLRIPDWWLQSDEWYFRTPYFRSSYRSSFRPDWLWPAVTHTTVYAVVGLYLLCDAPHIARWLSGDRRLSSPIDDNITSDKRPEAYPNDEDSGYRFAAQFFYGKGLNDQ